jgi:hypothetical protein
MAYIVACIEFDDNYNLKNVNIVDDESNLSNDTLETLIGNKETKFYIKILVNPCSSGEPDCFMLSNDNYFKLDFETLVPTANPILSEAFLSGPNASSTNVNASSTNVNASSTNVNASSSNVNASSTNVNASSSNVNASSTTAPGSFEEFKKRIIEELTKALTKESDFDKFKKRILEELTNALKS